MDITKRDKLLLMKIMQYQKTLNTAVNEMKISSPNDLNKIHELMRRGLVSTVCDIYELTVQMSDETLLKLPLQHNLIKQFRNTASHVYNEINNEMTFMCITHCVDKKLMKAVRDLIEDKDE
jgi:hypothetical protein